MDVMIVLSLVVFGAVLGSFAGATVWRLRAKQLIYDKAHGEAVDAAEYAHLSVLKNGFSANDRSRCLACKHQLAWYDLLPALSWLSTAGKCRYCTRAIGWFEPAIEIMTAGLLVLSYLLWPFALQNGVHWGIFLLWLVLIVNLVIVFWYDAKWYIVLEVTMWPLWVGSALFAILAYVTYGPYSLLSLAGSVAILAGLYWGLWAISRGKWVGLGDAQIGIALGLLLMDWKKAFLALILANAIGTLVVLPGLLTKKLSRTSAVPFGPLLIAGALISFFCGSAIITWFTSDFSLFLARVLYP